MYRNTTRFQDHIQTLKDKPEHVRQNIAIGVSGGITLLVFVGWLGALSNNHTFALKPAPTTEIPSPLAKAQETKDTFSTLLGAAGSAFGATTSPSEIKIVDTQPPARSAPAPEQTVIHY